VAGAKATLVGHSMGGKLAMLGALAFPELIDSMLIVDGTPRRVRVVSCRVPRVSCVSCCWAHSDWRGGGDHCPASPAVYRHSHDATFDALKAVPINDIRSKREADAVLVERLPHLSKAERNYFLANLTHKVRPPPFALVARVVPGVMPEARLT
jgi:pimeloyl-ACP methyl ester carboxylesterase